MNNARLYHTTTALDDHRILISGGLKSIDPPESSTSIEILNLEENSLIEAGFALHGRSGHTLTPLHNGTYLIAGGVENGIPLTQSELCHFISKNEINCEEGPQSSLARWGHSATLLSDERVLFIGGITTKPEPGRHSGGPVVSLEIYAP